MKRKRKVNRAKIIIVLLSIYALIYAVSNTMLYKMNNDIQTYTNNTEQLQEKIDLLQIEINTKNSREKIVQQHPDLQIRDNIYYLQPNVDNEQ